MDTENNKLYKKEFWNEENLKYLQPHYRLQKCARIINKIARGRECDLIDVGCGPATLAKLLDKNISYYGIDIAIHDPAPNLIEMDFLENEIGFGNKLFDIIVAQGVFEYIGGYQNQKLHEIKNILNENGKFITSYNNFNHIHKFIYQPYNNIKPINDFKSDLSSIFKIERCFPTSYNWMGREPRREKFKKIQMYLYMNIPIISRMFGVEFFFICSLYD